MSEITLLAEVTAFLRQPHGQFIAGQREAGRGAPFAVINPATGRAIAEVTAADSDQADRAMESARQALSQWREMPTLARGALLLKLADTLAEHREALAQLESLCSGKTITLVRMLELDQSVAFLRYFAGWAGKVTGETLDVSLPSMAGEKYTAFTRRQPLGVVVGIVPWNFSIMIAIWKLAAALVCGCTIVLKPSEYTPLTLLRDELAQRLDQQRISQRFLAGPVNICTLMPMRSIPFKVVCLLGMNDGVYPRTLPPLGFDLMSQKPQRGDRSRRDDDRYLFLEALMSAEQTLYISYIGRSIQDNSERFPSVLVQELVDYIGQSHCLAGDEELDCDASEARVKAHITHLHTRMPFDVANFQEDENKSYAREWLAAAGQQGEAHSDFIQPLTAPPIDSLPFDQLLRFWQHPVRAFFQQRLRVNFRAEEDDIPDDEPFTLEGLSRYQLNQQLLNTLIEEQDVSAMFRRFRAAGELPYGAFGELVWETQRLEMQALAERVMAERQQAQSMEIDLQCGGVNLTGWLQQVQPDGLLRWRPSLLSVSQGMQLWLEHLVYCSSGGTGESRLFVRKEGEWRFPALAPAEAQAYLNELVDGYLLGMSQPLLLLPESGGAWLKACYDAEKDVILMDEETQQKARSKFLQTYEGNMVVSGEGADIWYQRLWRSLEPAHYEEIIAQTQRYLLPLYRYHRSTQI